MNVKTNEIDLEEFKGLVNKANTRSGTCLSIEDCLERVNCCPEEAIDKLKKMLTEGSFEMNELQNHITILWILYDLGRIKFPIEDIGLALSVQNISKIEKNELASRLLQFLERNITFVD